MQDKAQRIFVIKGELRLRHREELRDEDSLVFNGVAQLELLHQLQQIDMRGCRVAVLLRAALLQDAV